RPRLRACDPGDAIRVSNNMQRPRLIMLCIVMTPLWKVQAQPMTSFTNAVSKTEPDLEPASETIWEHGVGEGFRSSTQSMGLSAGATYGVAAFGGHGPHDLALLSLTCGHMIGRVRSEAHWYRGNPEFRVELFSGAQFAPRREWLVG